MNYEGMSTPQSTLCSRTGMFECLTVTHKIHLFLFISGRLLASTLCTDQPMRQASYGDSPPPRSALVSLCSFCVQTENSLYSNSSRPLWFITRSFPGPFQMPGFPLLPDNLCSTFIQSPF